MVTATGRYSATAPLSPMAAGSCRSVAFRAGSAGPPDTQVPTTPTNLAANAVSSTQINLSWTASTDNVAVTGYQIERCQGAGCSNFALIGTTVTTTTYNNTGLAASTSYSYRVRATDAAGNLSGYSGIGDRHHAHYTGYDGTQCADEPGGGRDHDQCDQSHVDRIDRQRGGDRIPA